MGPKIVGCRESESFVVYGLRLILSFDIDFSKLMKITSGLAYSSARFRIAGLLLVYSGICFLALWLAYELRFDFEVPPDYRANRCVALFLAIPLKLVLLWRFGQFRGLLSFFRIPDLYRLFTALFLASLVLFLLRLIPRMDLLQIPRGIILADLLFSLTFLVGFRTGLRIYREKFVARGQSAGADRHRLAIIGAGSIGAALAAELLSRPQLGLRPVVFYDDDREKWGRDVHGIPILGSPDLLEKTVEDFGATRVAIAIPSLNAARIRSILDQSNHAGLETVTVPGIHELSTGQVRVEEMRRVSVEDLLGREPVPIQTDRISDLLADEVVLITGAGGSIGGELVRQIATFSPRKIILVDSSEQAVFAIGEELAERKSPVETIARVVDFRHSSAMRKILGEQRPSVLFHAAAYKHVPLMESQPWEAAANNALGTYSLARWAMEFGVDRFVLISTDKAINPTSVMGATKRLAEIALQTLSLESKSTRFLAVRFGNVLGSSGSVIPTFRRQIARGGPVTVTDPEVSRYFMTIPEAVGLVLQAAAMGEGGEIFLLEMGKPVKILDLARQMIQLSGFEPETEIPIEFIGLRPGEKLFEELNYVNEASEETPHPRIRRVKGRIPEIESFAAWIERFEEDYLQLSASDLMKRIAERVPEYRAGTGES